VSEWGPWIEHDGRVCPCGGEYVHAIHEFSYGLLKDDFGISGIHGGKSWDWSNHPEYSKIIRYRIRKPKGLTILEGILENLPKEVESVG